MGKIIKLSVQYLLYSNLFISVCALGLMYQTYYQLENPQPLGFLGGFVFFATLFNYSFQRMLPLKVIKRKTLTELMIWQLRHRYFIYALICISAIGTIICLLYLNPELYLLIIVTGIISVLYDLPINWGKSKSRSLRQTGVIKIFIIGIVWGMVTVVIPAVSAGTGYSDPDLWIILLERILFIIAITLPFDMRDVIVDKSYDLETIPSIIGKKSSIRLIGLLLLLTALLEFIRIGFDPVFSIAFGLLAANAITYIIILKGKDSKSYNYYLGILDGTMLLQALCIITVYVLTH